MHCSVGVHTPNQTGRRTSKLDRKLARAGRQANLLDQAADKPEGFARALGCPERVLKVCHLVAVERGKGRVQERLLIPESLQPVCRRYPLLLQRLDLGVDRQRIGAVGDGHDTLVDLARQSIDRGTQLMSLAVLP